MTEPLNGLERRGFLKQLAVLLGPVGILAERVLAASEDLSSFAASLTDAGDELSFWDKVRREFLLEEGLSHFNTGSLGSTPGFILDSVSRMSRELEANPVANMWGPMGEAAELVRQKAADFLGAEPGEIAVTRNTTEGMNLVASGMDLMPGDEVITTNHEHAGGMSCWEHLAEHGGVRIVQVDLSKTPEHQEEIINLIKGAITRRTRVISLSHVVSLTGLRMPLAGIADLARPRNILLVCDGAQAPGMLKVDVKDLKVDAYASSSHKWMLAPKGSGLLYIRKEVQDRIRPISLRSGYGVYTGSGGTRNAPHIAGHGMAMDFHETIGREKIESRTRTLAEYARGKASELPGVHILTPGDPSLASGIISLSLKDKNPASLASALWNEHRIVVKVVPATRIVDPALRSENYNALRISTHIYNTREEIDQLFNYLEKA